MAKLTPRGNLYNDPMQNVADALAEDIRQKQLAKKKKALLLAHIDQEGLLWCLSCFDPTHAQKEHCLEVRASDRGIDRDQCDGCGKILTAMN